MVNRWSVVLMLMMASLSGYALAGPSAEAQMEPLPFAVGETVTLYYGDQSRNPSFGGSIECAVAEIRGEYVRCSPSTRIGGGSNRVERWVTLKYVVQITKRQD